jgi:hypothetical protein
MGSDAALRKKPRALIDTSSRGIGKHENCRAALAFRKVMDTSLSGRRNGYARGRVRRSRPRCKSGQAVQRVLFSLASLGFRSKEDLRLTNARLFGAVRSQQVPHCNRRRLSGLAAIGRTRKRRGCQPCVPTMRSSGSRVMFGRVLLHPPWHLRCVGASNCGGVFNRARRPSCVPTGSSAATPALRS